MKTEQEAFVGRPIQAGILVATLSVLSFNSDAADFISNPTTLFSTPQYYGRFGATTPTQLNFANSFIGVTQYQPFSGGTDVFGGYVNANALVATSPTYMAMQNAFRQTQRAIAASAALGSATMPSAPGRTSWAVNAAAYQGLGGISFSFAHRLDTNVPLAITGAYSNGAGVAHIGRVGLMGEF
jgi:hypothetical protein